MKKTKKMLARLIMVAMIYFAPLLVAIDWCWTLVRFRKMTPFWPRLALYWKRVGEVAWLN